MPTTGNRHPRLKLNIPAGLFNRLTRANLEKSIPALIIQLLRSHLTDLELRKEFSKLNNRAIN